MRVAYMHIKVVNRAAAEKWARENAPIGAASIELYYEGYDVSAKLEKWQVDWCDHQPECHGISLLAN